VGGRLFFTGAHVPSEEGPDEGWELWVTDGTHEGTRLVRDVFPGRQSSTPEELSVLDGVVLFRALTQGLASDGNIRTLGRELWRSDGTPEGTCLLKDINPGRPGNPESMPTYEFSHSDPRGMLAMRGAALFSANDGSWDPEGSEGLWRTDGTPAGTSLIRRLDVGYVYAEPTFTAMDGVAYFPVGFNNEELWRTDGTPEGTRPVTSPSPPWRDVSHLTLSEGVLYFTAIQETTGTELWRTDGTSEGTWRLTDIHPGTVIRPCIVSMGGVVYFTAAQDATGAELWRTDGTPQGTRLVKDIHPGPGDAHLSCPRVIDGALYFTASQSNSRSDLWRSEGTEETTTVITPRTATGVPWQRPFPLAEGGFVFSATTPDTGTELWISDGTVEGTSLLADVFPGPASSNPREFVRAGNTLYFITGDALTRELWALPLSTSSPPLEEGLSRLTGPNPCPPLPDAGGAPDAGSEPDAGSNPDGVDAGDDTPPEFHPLPLDEGGCGTLPSAALPLAALLVLSVLARRGRGSSRAHE
jgi:ELWxxDGT repeat protein